LVDTGRSGKYVTCGSVLKLQNLAYKVRLHSHDVKYGSGSGQQSVTGTDTGDDVNSHASQEVSAFGENGNIEFTFRVLAIYFLAYSLVRRSW